MSKSTSLPADALAERVVRHFQALGFPGITEALVVRIRLKKGDRLAVEAAFDRAQQLGAAPPRQEFFELSVHGFYSSMRTLLVVKTAFNHDFGNSLSHQLPRVFFDDAPVVIDDALATGTKYDAMLKLSNNTDAGAVAVLLNDPNSSFFEYLESQAGYDWQTITGNLDVAAHKLTTVEEDLL